MFKMHLKSWRGRACVKYGPGYHGSFSFQASQKFYSMCLCFQFKKSSFVEITKFLATLIGITVVISGFIVGASSAALHKFISLKYSLINLFYDDDAQNFLDRNFLERITV